MRGRVVVWLVMLMLAAWSMTSFTNATVYTAKTDSITGKAESSSQFLGISHQTKSYTSHDPIYIYGNSGFTSANGVTSGSGTESDPYVIEGWDINGTIPTGRLACICISNTNAYVTIRNCYLHDGSNGISFSCVTNGKIDEVTFYNNLKDYSDIALSEASKNIIINCTIYSGIIFYNSSNNTMTNCTVCTDNDIGVFLFESSNNNITNCRAYNNSYGIYLREFSNNNVITNCAVYNNSCGIYLNHVSYNILRNNTIFNNKYNFGVSGPEITHYYQDIDASNTINDTPLCYIVEQSDLVLNENMAIGYLGLVSCKNITMNNLNLGGNIQGVVLINTSQSKITNCTIHSNYDYGIESRLSSDNQITNCTIVNSSSGILFFDSSNNTLKDCDIYNNSATGIFFYQSTNNTIVATKIHNNDGGICLQCHSQNNQIINCTINNNFWSGIFLYLYSNNNLIINCNISVTRADFYYDGIGVHIDHNSDNNTITNSKIYYNDYGVKISYGSANNQITKCDIEKNTFGIYIPEWYNTPLPYNNHIHHNNFINNAMQVFDECSNFWDNDYPGGGNYWSNYKGIDNYSGPNQDQPGSDGIGDTPYNISGGNNKDRYPLMSPWNASINQPPIADAGSDLIVYVNQTVSFGGTGYDPDGTIVFGEWDFNGDGTYDWDWYCDCPEAYIYNTTGIYTATFRVTDNDGATDTDVCTVTVIPINQPPIVNITYPTERKTVSGTVTITGTAYDSDSPPVGRVHNLDKDTWYNKIQAAVNNADAGNRIFVYPGVYYENVVMNKTLTLMGDDRSRTIIDGNGGDYVVNIRANWVNISGFTIANGGNGVCFWSCSNSTITNCTVVNSAMGVYIVSTIYVTASSNNIINCLVSNNTHGIYLNGASSNAIINCSISDNQVGCYIWESTNAILRGNVFLNNTHNFKVWAWGGLSCFYHDIDTSNTINGKPIYYVIEKKNLVYDGNSIDLGYLGLVSCNNVTVTNINSSNSTLEILLANTTYSKVTNCSLQITLIYSSNISVTNCILSGGYYGIFLVASSNNIISNCSISNNSKGIHMKATHINSSVNNLVTNCTISNNKQVGIELFGASYNKITCCSISNSYCGVSNDYSSNNHITNCTVYTNYYGVYFGSSSHNNRIMYCNITDNAYYGIYIYRDMWYPSPSNYNVFHHDNFINNTYNAYDPYTNYWDDGVGEGNHWSDYIGNDTNGDGIGDTPYNISGGSNKDHYPLVKPVNITLSKSRCLSLISFYLLRNVLRADNPNVGTEVQKVEIKIDNGSWQQANGTATWYFIWDTTTVSNGWHTIYARSYDGIDYSKVDSVGVYVANPISELIPHEPIYINGNDDFTPENGVVSGSGIESDPYIIEGYDINVSTASYPIYAGIHIENTDVYFIIRNCVIHEGYEEGIKYNYGIYFYNVTNDKIENVTFYNNYYGINLYYSSNSTITNCTIYNNSYGISLSRSLNCNVENCTVYNHTWYGILVSSQSSNTQIANCVVYNSSYCGIQIFSSTYNVVVNSAVYNNSRYGIYFSFSQHNQIANSAIYNHSNYNIYISSSLYDQITNSTIYNSNHGMYFYSCLYNQISNCSLYNNRYYGIYSSSSLYNLIKDNRIINCSKGIYFHFSFYNRITNCSLNNNSNSGIYFLFSSNNTVTKCNISANNWGIYLYSNSNNNYIYHNNFLNNTNNAYDECTNYWDCNSEGNHWSDYTGVDEDGDGIGDTPYNISGGDNKDRYPLMREFARLDKEPPIVTIIEQSQTITTASLTMHWTTNATDIQYYEISVDGSQWINVGTNTSYTFTNLVEGSNILYVRGIDKANNTGPSSSITITVEISEKIVHGKEEIDWLLYGSIIIVIFIALMLAGAGIIRARRVKRRKVFYPQKLKCVYCQEVTKITSSDRPLLFQCPKCGKKSVIK